MKISGALRTPLKLSFFALYACGITYWIAKLYLKITGEFGEAPSRTERIAGPIHVCLAFFFLVILGRVWESHVRPAFRRNLSRPTGLFFFFLTAFICATAVVILYGNEAWIVRAEYVHPILGACMLPVILFHALKKKGLLPNRKEP